MQQQYSKSWDLSSHSAKSSLTEPIGCCPSCAHWQRDTFDSFGHKSLLTNATDVNMRRPDVCVGLILESGDRRKDKLCVCVCLSCDQWNKWEAGENKMVENHHSALWPTSVLVKKMTAAINTRRPPSGLMDSFMQVSSGCYLFFPSHCHFLLFAFDLYRFSFNFK